MLRQTHAVEPLRISVRGLRPLVAVQRSLLPVRVRQGFSGAGVTVRQLVASSHLSSTGLVGEASDSLSALWSSAGLLDTLQFRRASAKASSLYAFAKIGASEESTAWMGLKFKTAATNASTGHVNLSISANEVRSCLRDGVCVLLQGLDGKKSPSFLYLLHQKCLAVLDQIPEPLSNSVFQPMLVPKTKLRDGGLQAFFQPFRLELRDQTSCDDLKARLVAILNTGMLQPFSALEDVDPWFEQVKKLATLGFVQRLQRRYSDHDLVAFELTTRDGKAVRVQHKVAGRWRNDNQFNVQPLCGRDDFEVLQLTEAVERRPTGVVYAIPSASLTDEDRAKLTVRMSKPWLARFAPYRCDLRTDVGRRKFADICSAAGR